VWDEKVGRLPSDTHVSRPFRRMLARPVCGVLDGMRKAALFSLGLGAAGAAILVVGCGSGGSQPSDFCKSVAALDSAVAQINQTYLTKSTVPAVETSMATLGTTVQNLSKTAEPEFADEVKPVEAAATSLDKTVTAAVGQPVPANVDAARASMRDLTSAVKDLSKSTSETC
jgi:hypothetical protein